MERLGDAVIAAALIWLTLAGLIGIGYGAVWVGDRWCEWRERRGNGGG